MKHQTIFRALLGISIALMAGCASTGHPPAVGWLEGDWRGDAWGGRFEVSYLTREDGTAIGISRLYRDGVEAYHEFEVFEYRDDILTVVPFPRGKQADVLAFTEPESSRTRAVFENPEKDYPTRISYERIGRDSLVITLSDPHGESAKQETFQLVRVDADE